MKYDINKLPDFFSVRDIDQINYSLEGLEGKKCFAFFDNGFTSNIIEPNKRDIRFVWDGFLLFVDSNITLEDIKNKIDLFDGRIVALQRTSLSGNKSNSTDIREYIIKSLNEKNIPIEIMPDKKEVNGYPSKCDLWSTRDSSVLIDAVDCVGSTGDAYYFNNSSFQYEIEFNESKLPSFPYSHKGAVVLKGENSTAIARLVCNDQNLCEHLEKVIGEDKLYSVLEGKELSGTTIDKIESKTKSTS